MSVSTATTGPAARTSGRVPVRLSGFVLAAVSSFVIATSFAGGGSGATRMRVTEDVRTAPAVEVPAFAPPQVRASPCEAGDLDQATRSLFEAFGLCSP
jgi:hypothetical protein